MLRQYCPRDAHFDVIDLVEQREFHSATATRLRAVREYADLDLPRQHGDRFEKLHDQIGNMIDTTTCKSSEIHTSSLVNMNILMSIDLMEFLRSTNKSNTAPVRWPAMKLSLLGDPLGSVFFSARRTVLTLVMTPL